MKKVFRVTERVYTTRRSSLANDGRGRCYSEIYEKEQDALEDMHCRVRGFPKRSSSIGTQNRKAVFVCNSKL